MFGGGGLFGNLFGGPNVHPQNNIGSNFNVFFFGGFGLLPLLISLVSVYPNLAKT